MNLRRRLKTTSAFCGSSPHEVSLHFKGLLFLLLCYSHSRALPLPLPLPLPLTYPHTPPPTTNTQLHLALVQPQHLSNYFFIPGNQAAK